MEISVADAGVSWLKNPYIGHFKWQPVQKKNFEEIISAVHRLHFGGEK
jgi:hypothetical protein